MEKVVVPVIVPNDVTVACIRALPDVVIADHDVLLGPAEIRRDRYRLRPIDSVRGLQDDGSVRLIVAAVRVAGDRQNAE